MHVELDPGFIKTKQLMFPEAKYNQEITVMMHSLATSLV